MIRAWCRSGPYVQKGLIYVKYVEPQTFYQWCCVDYNSGGILVTIPCVKPLSSVRNTPEEHQLGVGYFSSSRTAVVCGPLGKPPEV
ncbi:hypothetical protein TNCV_2487091 [Trichonephila clavipes]|uniref:Uncharacterized protein n=1 Tax=Trichonephila clavipes TaxID=2585209 RepID=A0A8X6W044_TRICX|nr:hypothetical protein TNCV_2487091 [Trichonephila clavipes]